MSDLLIDLREEYKFFSHKKCEAYPCHILEGEELNCLFCYCPLYHMSICQGEFIIIGEGVKDCSQCTFPHKLENYDTIVALLREGT